MLDLEAFLYRCDNALKRTRLCLKHTFIVGSKIMVRVERDSLGDIEVPEHALYGAQTQRAVDNFQIAQRPMPVAFLEALAWVKLTAAKTNGVLKLLNPDIETSIVQAALLVLEGNHWSEFPVDVFQTGSGTSSNMNMNEVLAHLASKKFNITSC